MAISVAGRSAMGSRQRCQRGSNNSAVQPVEVAEGGAPGPMAGGTTACGFGTFASAESPGRTAFPGLQGKARQDKTRLWGGGGGGGGCGGHAKRQALLVPSWVVLSCCLLLLLLSMEMETEMEMEMPLFGLRRRIPSLSSSPPPYLPNGEDLPG